MNVECTFSKSNKHFIARFESSLSKVKRIIHRAICLMRNSYVLKGVMAQMLRQWTQDRKVLGLITGRGRKVAKYIFSWFLSQSLKHIYAVLIWKPCRHSWIEMPRPCSDYLYRKRKSKLARSGSIKKLYKYVWNNQTNCKRPTLRSGNILKKAVSRLQVFVIMVIQK